MINVIDVGIIIAVLFAASSGYRRGFWLSLSQYIGLLLGVLVGAALAPFAVDGLQIAGAGARSLAAVAVLVVAGTLGSSLGYWLGQPLRLLVLSGPGRGRLDSAVGAIFSVVGVLGVSWFLGLSLSQGPSRDVARLIQRSAILRTLDTIAPRPPAFLARVGKILSGVTFPSVFSGLEPLIPTTQRPFPGSVDTPGIRAAAEETVKVEGRGCGGVVFGSGFPVASGQVLTNAHVVAGTRGTTVVTPGGQQLRATVVLFDPGRDLAVLNVPGLRMRPLAMADAGRGTQGAAIGYPGGGPETVEPAVVDNGVRAEGRDIYGQSLVVRQIWVIEADVKPGNSGGPLVDRDGNVIGVIFAASTSQPGQAYALTDQEAQGDVQAAQGRTQPVSTQQCAL